MEEEVRNKEEEKTNGENSNELANANIAEEKNKEVSSEDMSKEEQTNNELQPFKNNNKKKILIIVGIVLLLAVIVITIVIIFSTGKDKNKSSGTAENSNKIENNESNSNTSQEPNTNLVKQKIVSTEISNKKEVGTGKEVKIYKVIDKEDNSLNSYYFEEEEPTEDDDYKYVYYSKINCKTNECVAKEYFNNYAIIEEADGAYLIDSKTNEIVYGPFGIKMTKADDGEDYYYDEEDKYHFLYDYIYDYDDNKLEAIVISRKNKSTIFDLYNFREYKNLNGVHQMANYMSPTESLKYGYLVLYDFKSSDGDIAYSYVYDLSTDYLLSKYNCFIQAFIYNKELYVAEDKEDSPYKIKNAEGYNLFDGKEFTSYDTENNNLLLSDNNYFYVYNKDLKLVKQSNKYTNIVMLGKQFVLVNNNNKLQLVDLNDKLLTTFIKNYNSKKHIVHTALSGWFTENKKNGIYIVVEQTDLTAKVVLKENPKLTKEDVDGANLGYEYYYIPKTKETGKIATFIGGYAKPVLYLYPTKTTNVQVGFKYPELLTTTYPKFNKYWNVTVDKNGNMTDSKGRHYYALYWEEASNKKVTFDEGFYVESKDAIKFLEEKLDTIGLNEREANEFIMYWLPILEKNKKSLVYFELTEEREKFNKLLISPKPDSLLRVAIHIKKVDKKVNIKEQKLTHFNRKGFSAIEWGGYLY